MEPDVLDRNGALLLVVLYVAKNQIGNRVGGACRTSAQIVSAVVRRCVGLFVSRRIPVKAEFQRVRSDKLGEVIVDCRGFFQAAKSSAEAGPVKGKVVDLR